MPITFKKHVLPNGLTIIAECDPDAHTAACGFFVRTGARDEAPAVMGVSHFLEHMMFKGTETLTSDDINRGFDELGARNNAFTSNEMTCFYAHVLPEHLDAATDLLGKMMRPALRNSDFDTEKGVILEEIAMYKDNPFWVLYEACVEKHYPNHPMSHRVLGTNETITALSRDQMAGYFNHRYSADTTTVAFAGRVNFDRAVKHVESLCGTWPRTGAERDSKSPPVWEGSFEIRDEKVSRAYMLGMALAPSAQDPRRYAAAMLAQILGGPDNSRLHWALIETGLADEAQAAHDPHDGTGEYYVYCSCDPENAPECWSVVEREIANLPDSLTEDDLMRLRNKLATAVTLGGERPHDRMHRIGRLWTLLGEYRTLEEELAQINAVTLADLREVAAAYPISKMTMGRLLPSEPQSAGAPKTEYTASIMTEVGSQNAPARLSEVLDHHEVLFRCLERRRTPIAWNPVPFVLTWETRHDCTQMIDRDARHAHPVILLAIGFASTLAIPAYAVIDSWPNLSFGLVMGAICLAMPVALIGFLAARLAMATNALTVRDRGSVVASRGLTWTVRRHVSEGSGGVVVRPCSLRSKLARRRFEGHAVFVAAGRASVVCAVVHSEAEATQYAQRLSQATGLPVAAETAILTGYCAGLAIGDT